MKVVVPSTRKEALKIFENEILPYLRHNPESWSLKELYIEAMESKFKFSMNRKKAYV